MSRVLLLTFGIFIIEPSISNAAVFINEVAWMGNENSANDEWIELYNTDGSAVSVDGWTLSDGMNLSIDLAGTIGAGQYAVLERTDDTSAPGTAFLVYTGALTNAGATLTLKRSDGGTEDSVAGGENWENIGGDNVTKETAQYTESGWVTGPPTPGSSNVAYEPLSEPETETESTSESAVSSAKTSAKKSVKSSKPTYLVLSDATLSLTLTAPEVAYVNQPVDFKVEPKGLGKRLMPSLKLSWNFGDLETAVGKEVSHAYQYPGQYVVVAEGEYLRHYATIRHEITVLPVAFSLTQNNNGDLQINNDSKYEIDLSNYSLRGNETVVVPDGTILLPNSTLTVPKKKLGNSPLTWLMDQANVVVASIGFTKPDYSLAMASESAGEGRAASPPAPTASAMSSAVPPTMEPVSADQTNQNFNFTSEPPPSIIPAVEAAQAEANQPSEETDQSQAVVSESVPSPVNDKLPYLGLIGVLSLGVLALYATRIR